MPLLRSLSRSLALILATIAPGAWFFYGDGADATAEETSPAANKPESKRPTDSPPAAQEPDPAQVAFFETKIRPLLIERCLECHGEKTQHGGLRLDSRAGWQAGGDSGMAVAPGKPEASLLIKAIRHTDKELQMPPPDKGGKLSAEQIALLEEWVRRGAVDPRVPAERIGGMTAVEAKSWWAWQPLRDKAALARANSLPSSAPTAVVIDAFINAKLVDKKIVAAPRADKRTLLRRATFDLTGLPPTEAEAAAFLADDSPTAFAKVIDRLLAAPQYGEHWGRHWLDVVRYADSLDARGYDQDGDILDAWRYRDWVVNAFNADLPYDQFVTRQIAGDILAAQSGKYDPQLVIATGLFAIGEWGNGDADKEKIHTDIVDDQIDVLCRGFLGVTVACARCHDHKFDPFTAKDYTGLAGFFYSSRILAAFTPKGAGEKLMRIPLLSPEEEQQRAKLQARLGEIQAKLAAQLQPLSKPEREIAGIAGLVGWKSAGEGNPSMAVNTTDKPVAFSTIKLPAKSFCLHPGPTTSVSAVWRSQLGGVIEVSAKLFDADPNCGNGIEWEARRGDQSLGKGTVNNAGSAEFQTTQVTVNTGELVQLIIRPRGEYSCDSTRVEFTITAADGKRWDLREALMAGADPAKDAVWAICSGEGTQLAADDAANQTLIAEQQKLQAEMPLPSFAQGLQEGGIPATPYAGFHDAQVHERGRYDRLGESVKRRVPAIFTSDAANASQPLVNDGSGRLELARWVANPANPLTARVMANRVWQWHFGEGLARTENNFGKLGTPPTHPELLDWLAAELLEKGWSIKALHRAIMLSDAYQRAATPSESAAATDPDNQWLSHWSRRQLSAEELRDALLAATGELDRAVGGKGTRDVNTPRRTLYLATVRSDRSNYQALFDGANPTAIVEARINSVVAPQALWLLNHPFALARAKALAELAGKQEGDSATKMRWLARRLWQRDPTAAELAVAARAGDNWEALCQVLLCSNELIYVD